MPFKQTELVSTPNGFGMVAHISGNQKEVCVWIGKELYVFPLNKVKPIDPAVKDILRCIDAV